MGRGRPARRYTLPELADAAEMTVRNVRSYQTRGLIPAPQRQGRRSVYTDEHLRRLRQIRDARARGATLSLISSHIAGGGSLGPRGGDRPWPAPAHGRFDPARRRYTVAVDAVLSTSTMPRAQLTRTIDALVAQGVLHRRGDQVRAERPVATALTEAAADGLPVDRVLEVLSVAAAAGRSIAVALEAALPEGPHEGDCRRRLVDLAAYALDVAVRPGPPG